MSEVAPTDRLADATQRWAAEILECAPLAVRASKEAVTAGRSLPLERAFHIQVPGVAEWSGSEDPFEGPPAFAEKRKPEWRGR